MAFPFGSFVDPPSQERDLIWREFLVRLRWRHDIVRLFGEEASDQFARIRIAGDDGGVFSACRSLASVESKISFAGMLVRSVAVETIVGKDRSDIAIERNFNVGEGRF